MPDSACSPIGAGIRVKVVMPPFYCQALQPRYDKGLRGPMREVYHYFRISVQGSAFVTRSDMYMRNSSEASSIMLRVYRQVDRVYHRVIICLRMRTSKMTKDISAICASRWLGSDCREVAKDSLMGPQVHEAMTRWIDYDYLNAKILRL